MCATSPLEVALEKQKIKDHGEEKAYKLQLDEEKILKRIENEQVELPNLEITKFKGTHLDWVRSWNQFGMSIDKSKLPPAANFHTFHTGKYGKPSEIEEAHIQSIIKSRRPEA